MQLHTRQVLAVEIPNDVDSYKVEIHVHHKCILEKEEQTLQATS